MRLFTWVILLPLMELAVLAILIAGGVGGHVTWIWFAATFVVGFVLSRPSPRAAGRPGAWWRRIAGYCLMFPGPLTDLVAVALLVPASRNWLLGALRKEVTEAAWISIGRPAPPGRPGKAPSSPGHPEEGEPRRSRRRKSMVRDAEFEILGDESSPRG